MSPLPGLPRSNFLYTMACTILEMNGDSQLEFTCFYLTLTIVTKVKYVLHVSVVRIWFNIARKVLKNYMEIDEQNIHRGQEQWSGSRLQC